MIRQVYFQVQTLKIFDENLKQSTSQRILECSGLYLVFQMQSFFLFSKKNEEIIA